MSYNFSYSYQHDTVHHWPFITGDTLVLNLSANSQQCCYDKSASSGNLNRPAIYPQSNYGESLQNRERSVVTPDQKPCPDSNHDHNPKPNPDDQQRCQVVTPDQKPCLPCPDSNHDHNPKPHPKPNPDDQQGCQVVTPDQKPCPDSNHDHNPKPHPKPNPNPKPNPDDQQGCQVVTPDQKPCLPCPDSNHDYNPKPHPKPNPNPKPNPDDQQGYQVVTPDQKPCLSCPDSNHDYNPKPHPKPNPNPKPDDQQECQVMTPDQKPCLSCPDSNHDYNPKPHPDDRKGCQDDGEPYTVVAKEITADHADPNKDCGYYAGYYQSYGHVGHYGFNTACILKKWFPNFDKNPALKEKLGSVTSPVMAGNFKLAIVGDNIDYTWAKASDMWCRQCQNYDNDKACTWEHNGVKAYSTCYAAGSNGSTIYSHNFFSETECPNLISSEVRAREKPKEIYIKLVEPIVLYDHSTQKIISRNGKMTDQNYFICKEYINSNFTNDGKVVENSCDKDYYKAQCQSCIKALEEALWTAKDPIKLKIPAKKQVADFLDRGDTQNEDPFSSLSYNKMQDDEAFIFVDGHNFM